MTGYFTENFLDLENIFINEIAGNEIIFIALSLIAITFFGAIFRFPNMIIAMILFAWLLFLSAFIPVLLPFVVILGGAFIAWQLTKYITRG